MTAIAAREHVLRCRGLSEAWTADDKRYKDVLERVLKQEFQALTSETTTVR